MYQDSKEFHMAGKDGGKSGGSNTPRPVERAINEGYTIIRKGGYTPDVQAATTPTTDALPAAPASGTGEASPTQGSSGTEQAGS